MKKKKRTVVERFWSFVDKTNDCWLWQGACHKTFGHGLFRKDKMVYAHRYSWELFYDRNIPAGMFVCHTCDVPNCVNPSHLFLGTAKDNSRDMSHKGRSCRGELNCKAVLTELDVKAIRQLSNLLQLSKQYSVTPRTILDIVTGHTWKHIQ